MKKLPLLLKLPSLLLLAIFAFYSCGNDNDTDTPSTDDDDVQTYVLDLPSYTTHTFDMGDLENPDDKWSINEDWGGTTNYKYNLLTDKSGIFEFDCVESTYGFYSDSFAFTNCKENGCPDFAGYDYRAITKKGVTNDTYVVVGSAGYKIGENADKEVAIRFRDHDNLKELENYKVKGLYVTNSVFAYTSMTVGTPFYQEQGKDDKFGKDDYLKLTIFNLDKTQHVDCYLAQGTNIINQWQWVDLAALGETKGLKFELKTTKIDGGWPMTPTYFCLDGITLID